MFYRGKYSRSLYAKNVKHIIMVVPNGSMLYLPGTIIKDLMVSDLEPTNPSDDELTLIPDKLKLELL